MQEPYPAVAQWLDYYRNHSGKNYLVQKKYEFSEHPSIQGMWTPFVHADPEIATAKFPLEKLTQPLGVPKSASEYLKELHENQSKIAVPEDQEAQLELTKQS